MGAFWGALGEFFRYFFSFLGAVWGGVVTFPRFRKKEVDKEPCHHPTGGALSKWTVRLEILNRPKILVFREIYKGPNSPCSQ